MRRRLGIALALVVAVVVGVGSASALVGGQGQDTPASPEALQPDGSGASIVAAADDPAGGPPWAVRVYRSQTGLTCPEAGRTQDGSFGQVDQDGKFQPTGIEASGSCADLGKAPVALAVNHYAEHGTVAAHAAIFGATSAAVKGLTLHLASGSRTLSFAHGGFVAVSSEDELMDASLDATLADGSTKSYTLQANRLPAVEQPPEVP